MSCFSGSFEALPGVRCDRFEQFIGGGGLTAADQFFLSHCHTDHMKGFSELAGLLKRKSKGSKVNNKLYCSNISKAFVQKKYKIPDCCFFILESNVPKELFVYDSISENIYSIRVTGIGANHCPGSLMFLFEKLDDSKNVEKRILYTGDFRFDSSEENQNPLTQLEKLHDRMKNPLHIDEMYLDTTFCSKQYETFPSRIDAEEKIWNQCDKWIRRNGLYKHNRNKHVILLTLPARYGYERILQHVYKGSGKKWRVHVNKDKFGEYLCTKELADCAEPDQTRAQWIHACTTWEKGRKSIPGTLPCQPGEQFEVCQIKPSATYFTKEKMDSLSNAQLDTGMSLSQGVNYYRICYSSHSSLTELRDFVTHFSPQKIIPCAIPRNSSRKEVSSLLDTCMGRMDIPGSISSSPQNCLFFSQPFVSPTKKNESPDSCAILFESQAVSLPSKADTQESKVSFDRFMDMEERHHESSEEEGEKENCRNNNIEIIPVPGIVNINNQDINETQTTRNSFTISGGNMSTTFSVDSKRKTFAHSRVNQTYYSMPVQQEIPGLESQKERRSSMPSNMKLPVIRVTPSSPSPDPDDPDYPEFFQGRLYLEHSGRNPDYLVDSNTNNNPEDKDSKKTGGEGEPEAGPSNTSGDTKRVQQADNTATENIRVISRMKRQQSMFTDDHDQEDNQPSVSFKKPRLNLLSKMGKSFEADSLNKVVDFGDTTDTVKNELKSDISLPGEYVNLDDNRNKVKMDDDAIEDIITEEVVTNKIILTKQETIETEIEIDFKSSTVKTDICNNRKRKMSIFYREEYIPAKHKILVAESQDFTESCKLNDTLAEDDKNLSRSPVISRRSRLIKTYSKDIKHRSDTISEEIDINEENVSDETKDINKEMFHSKDNFGHESQAVSGQESHAVICHESQDFLSHESQDVIGHESQDVIGHEAQDVIGHESQEMLGHESQNVLGNESQDVIGHESQEMLCHESQDVIGHESQDVIGQESQDVIGHESQDVIGHESQNVLGHESNDVIGHESQAVLGLVTQDILENETQELLGHESKDKLDNEPHYILDQDASQETLCIESDLKDSNRINDAKKTDIKSNKDDDVIVGIFKDNHAKDETKEADSNLVLNDSSKTNLFLESQSLIKSWGKSSKQIVKPGHIEVKDEDSKESSKGNDSKVEDNLEITEESMEIITIDSSEELEPPSPPRSPTPDIEEVLQVASQKNYSEKIMKNLRAIAEVKRREKQSKH